MAEKELKARIVHKHDTEANWNKATNFIPKESEFIVYDMDDTHNYFRLKIGDGVTDVINLPFYGGSLEHILDGIADGSIRTSNSAPEDANYKLGTDAFAEGKGTKASGNFSHAEGFNTTASSAYSHAEGRGTTASGTVSHAEGTDTVASGARSHAGGYGTIAKGDNQTAIGKYNIEDVSNKYAFIIGNGTSSTRKNALTVDWSGNVEADGKKLATEEYADAATTTLQNTYVPNTRKVNGKALNADITLTASDVGALGNDYKPVWIITGDYNLATNQISNIDKTYTNIKAAIDSGYQVERRLNVAGMGVISLPYTTTVSYRNGISFESSFNFDAIITHAWILVDESNTWWPHIYNALTRDDESSYSADNYRISQLGDPGDATDAANKQYVDTAISGISIPVTSVNSKTGAVELTANDIGALPNTTKIPTKTSDLDNDSGFITSAPVTSVNSKTGAVTLGAGDVGALPTTGGTLTGNLKVGSASLGTNGYVVGTWLQGTAANHLSYAATKIAVQDGSGWVYHRTASEVKSDIGAGNTNTYKISNPTVATSSWVANTNSQAADQEKTDYPFMATISITTPAVTTNDIARVMFGYTEQASGNFAPNCYTTTNGVIIEAKEKPSATITLDYILIERIL